MPRPFVLRVQCDDAAIARSIADALVAPLGERGARIHVDGMPLGGGSAFGVHLMTGPRGIPGVSLRIGLWDEGEGARWLVPIDVPTEPQRAVSEIVRFLETWGFLTVSASAPGAPPPSRT